MGVRRTITVSITSEQDALIRACLQSGRYSSTSEVVRAALRLLDRDEAGSGGRTSDMTPARQAQNNV